MRRTPSTPAPSTAPADWPALLAEAEDTCANEGHDLAKAHSEIWDGPKGRGGIVIARRLYIYCRRCPLYVPQP